MWILWSSILNCNCFLVKNQACRISWKIIYKDGYWVQLAFFPVPLWLMTLQGADRFATAASPEISFALNKQQSSKKKNLYMAFTFLASWLVVAFWVWHSSDPVKTKTKTKHSCSNIAMKTACMNYVKVIARQKFVI